MTNRDSLIAQLERAAPLESSDINATGNGESMGCEEMGRISVRSDMEDAFARTDKGTSKAQVATSSCNESLPANTRIMGGVQPQAISQEQPVANNGDNVIPPAPVCSEVSVDGLTFNQNDVDNLVAIYNDSIFITPMQESLFRAIKVCKERLSTTEPVSISLRECYEALFKSKHHTGSINDARILAKAVLDAAGVAYAD